MSIRIGTGSISAELDDGLERLIRRTLEDVAPGVAEEIETETRALHDDAVRAWPVGSRAGRAHSRDLMRWEVRISPDFDEISGRITNSAPYAKFIYSQKTWYRNAFVELLRKPARKALTRFAKRVAARAAQEMGA